MKKICFCGLFILMFASCNNAIKQTANSYNDYTESVDTVVSDVSTVDMLDEVPMGYTREVYKEYVPKNDVERKFLSDMKKFSEALNSRNSEMIVKLYYPDYFVLLQKQATDKSIKQIKDKVQSYYENNFDAIIGAYTKDWAKANRAGVRITNILNRINENGKMLYLYEYHTMLSSSEDTIFKKEAEYSVAASLNNGKQWYSSADNINDIFEILSISFSREAIDKVLTKQ